MKNKDPEAIVDAWLAENEVKAEPVLREVMVSTVDLYQEAEGAGMDKVAQSVAREELLGVVERVGRLREILGKLNSELVTALEVDGRVDPNSLAMLWVNEFYLKKLSKGFADLGEHVYMIDLRVAEKVAHALNTEGMN